MKKIINIVIPAFNEELVIQELTRRLSLLMDKLPKYTFEVIVVENASTDDTLKELLRARKKDQRFKILQLSTNYGCDGAIVAGVHYARGDAVIIMMADLQDVPELIPEFLKRWEEGYDIVYGIVKKRVHMGLMRRFGTFLFYKIMSKLSKGLIPENVSDFRLIDRKVYRVILSMPEHNKFFRGLVMWTGYKKIGIPFIRPDRIAGKSKADLPTMLSVALNGIISFSSLPLRISWLIAGLFISGMLISLIVLRFQLSLIFFSLSLVTILISIQNEYIGRILEEVRGRPHFVVQNTYGFSKTKKI
ncbi:MAG: glycosyltransferase family 2 protein [bacterium]|nr:glycosyltransferase family 2 protein [bacterium]